METPNVPVATAVAVPTAAVAVPMAAVAVPMPQPAGPIAGVVDEDTTPSELWRTYQRFHPDKGLVIFWMLLSGTAVAVAGIAECIEFFADGGLSQFAEEAVVNTTSAEGANTDAFSSATFLTARVADVFILGDLIRNFMTAYRMADGWDRPRRQPPCGRYEARGRLETRSNLIAQKYLRSWFFVDLLILVSSAISFLLPSGPLMRPLRILRVLRIIRAGQDFQIIQTVFCQSKPPPAAV